MKDKNLEDMENLEAGELPEENIVTLEVVKQ